MIEPAAHAEEQERLKELLSFKILDTEEENVFDNLTKIASSVCDTPISLITLVDDSRQWFKSHHGITLRETSRKLSFCAHALNKPDDFFIIEDSRKDERFKDNPLVINPPHVIFYAGYPLVTKKGLPLGTFCVIDSKPRKLSDDQLHCLQLLADETLALLSYNKEIAELEGKLKQHDYLHREVHHRVKNNFQVISSLLHLQSSLVKDPKIKSLFRYLHYRINSQVIIHELLYESRDLTQVNLKDYFLNLINHLIVAMKGSRNKVDFVPDLDSIHINVETAINIGLIINELVTNALKYGISDDRPGMLNITLESMEKNRFRITLSDDGPGFSKSVSFRDSKSLGLELVHNLILQLNGNIEKDNSFDGTRYIIFFEEIPSHI